MIITSIRLRRNRDFDVTVTSKVTVTLGRDRLVIMGMGIRLCAKRDAAAMRAVHKAIYPDDRAMPDGRSWLMWDGEKVVGYTAVASVPGLGGVFSLAGGVIPAYRRQGAGSRLLHHVLRHASSLGIKQLSHAVTDLNSPAAHFLRRHGFFIEHEEWLLRLPNLQTRQLTYAIPANLRVHPLTPSPVHLFRTLYDRSFGGAPWYQPYSQAEAAETLDDPNDILFLFKDGHAVGFAWLQGEMIEPVGVVKEEQGQGYGRTLLLAALHKLKQRGVKQVKIGVWRENVTAVHLYQSLGFQREKILTYLALDLR